jgi:hypothetical protein
MNQAISVFCQWLQQTPVGVFMSESVWAFPAVEAVHILCGNVPLIVSTSILSFRLTGWGLREFPVSTLVKALLPWAWAAFLVQVVTGVLLFSTSAPQYAATRTFLIKMFLILLAGLNALVFLRTTYRRVAEWDMAAIPPLGARAAGCISILLWFSVLVMGRILNTAVTLVNLARIF